MPLKPTIQDCTISPATLQMMRMSSRHLRKLALVLGIPSVGSSPVQVFQTLAQQSISLLSSSDVSWMSMSWERFMLPKQLLDK